MRNVQDIDVASGREPLVKRFDVPNSVLLTFRGVRNAKFEIAKPAFG